MSDLTFSDLEKTYADIGGVEKWREYDFGNGRVYRIENPIKLKVQPSGAHRLIDALGNRHYVPAGFIGFKFDGQWVF